MPPLRGSRAHQGLSSQSVQNSPFQAAARHPHPKAHPRWKGGSPGS